MITSPHIAQPVAKTSATARGPASPRRTPDSVSDTGYKTTDRLLDESSRLPIWPGASVLSRHVDREADAFTQKLAKPPSQGQRPLARRTIQARLRVGSIDDPMEAEADRVADQAMAHPNLALDSSTIRRAARFGSSHNRTSHHVPSIVEDVVSSGGRFLDPSTRADVEQRLGYDFGHVRIHTGIQADAAARSIGALALTSGSDVVFAQGQYSPGTREGRRLLVHELAHVVQQGTAAPTTDGRGGREAKRTARVPSQRGRTAQLIQRKPPAATTPADPLCADYAYVVEKILVEGLIDDMVAAPDVEKHLELVRELKWILRCGTDSEKDDTKAALETRLGAKTSAAIWKEAKTPFGGYRGAYPGYYGGAKGRLKRLGTSEVEAYDAFRFDPKTGDPATFRSRRESAATTEAPTLAATDLLYFYGHQYAQYSNPGVFANGTQTQWIDLRSLAGKGDFSRVKLIVSTSCATCCKEAVETFAPLFPNAVILGYRKSAPIDGEAVRNDFDKAIHRLKRPLLLDEPVDVSAIIGVWKSVVKKHHPKEDKRLPGYYQGGTVHYLENGIWDSMKATDAANTCRKKGTTLDEAAH